METCPPLKSIFVINGEIIRDGDLRTPKIEYTEINGKSAWKCLTCGLQNYKRKHSKTHKCTPQRVDVRKCQECKKEFINNKELIFHLKVHGIFIYK